MTNEDAYWLVVNIIELHRAMKAHAGESVAIAAFNADKAFEILWQEEKATGFWGTDAAFRRLTYLRAAEENIPIEQLQEMYGVID